jgi:hypothetical protein
MSETEHERMDPEDLGTLGEMLSLGSQYIQEQDEPEDQKNISPMQQALGLIAGLVPVEVAEAEPATESEDEGGGD